MRRLPPISSKSDTTLEREYRIRRTNKTISNVYIRKDILWSNKSKLNEPALSKPTLHPNHSVFMLIHKLAQTADINNFLYGHGGKCKCSR